MDRLEDVRVSALDRGRLAGQVDWHFDRDLLFEADRVEVDVDGPQAPRMGLDLAHEDFLRPILVDHQVDQVRPSGLDEHLLELEPVEHEGGRLRVVAVDDGGQLSLAIQAPGALAEQFTGGGVQLHGSASVGEASL